MRRLITAGALVGALVIVSAAPTFAAPPPTAQLYLVGHLVRTIVPPAAAPKQGVDDFYAVMGGVASHEGIAAVGPGDKDYHGGKWAFHEVTWNVALYLLTSEADVLAAETAGHVNVSRVVANDFKCPIQPK